MNILPVDPALPTLKPGETRTTSIVVPGDGKTRIIVLSTTWKPYCLTWPAWRQRYHQHWQSREIVGDLFVRGGTWPVTIFAAEDRAQPWGDFVAEALAQVAEPVVLVFCDDMVLTADVDLAELHRCRQEMDDEKADYFRVVPTPECGKPFAHGRSGEHGDGPYAFSLYPAFHRREYLIAHARGVPTPWDFEVSPHHAPIGKHLAVTRSNRPLSICELLKRGTWTLDGYRVMKEGGWPTA